MLNGIRRSRCAGTRDGVTGMLDGAETIATDQSRPTNHNRLTTTN